MGVRRSDPHVHPSQRAGVDTPSFALELSVCGKRAWKILDPGRAGPVQTPSARAVSLSMCSSVQGRAGSRDLTGRCHICLPGKKKKKKSGALIFHHLEPEVYLRSLKSLTEFYTCRGGFYFEYPLNTLWVGVFPVLERCMYSDK